MIQSNGAAATAAGAASLADPHLASAPLRLLIVADSWGPTQEISFAAALRRWREAGAAALSAFDERGLAKLRKDGGQEAVEAFIIGQFATTRPTAVVLSRYGGIDYKFILAEARQRGIPVVFHMDDDILEVPIALGVELYRRYRHSRRLHAFYRIVEAVDLVYVSTPALGKRLREHCDVNSLFVADIYTGANTPRPPAPPDAPKRAGEVRIGYMGSAGHAFDFEYVLEPMHSLLRRHQNITFHLFGTIGTTDVAKEFSGDRVVVSPNVAGSYWDFRQHLAGLGWDIGLAPLRPSDFNNCKAPTKWVEYSEAGIAVLASEGPVYEPMAQQGAARLAASGAWEASIEELILNAEARAGLVQNAQDLLVKSYSWRRVEDQVLDLVAALRRDDALLPTG